MARWQDVYGLLLGGRRPEEIGAVLGVPPSRLRRMLASRRLARRLGVDVAMELLRARVQGAHGPVEARDAGQTAPTAPPGDGGFQDVPASLPVGAPATIVPGRFPTVADAFPIVPNRSQWCPTVPNGTGAASGTSFHNTLLDMALEQTYPPGAPVPFGSTVFPRTTEAFAQRLGEFWWTGAEPPEKRRTRQQQRQQPQQQQQQRHPRAMRGASTTTATTTATTTTTAGGTPATRNVASSPQAGIIVRREFRRT